MIMKKGNNRDPNDPNMNNALREVRDSGIPDDLKGVKPNDDSTITTPTTTPTNEGQNSSASR